MSSTARSIRCTTICSTTSSRSRCSPANPQLIVDQDRRAGEGSQRADRLAEGEPGKITAGTAGVGSASHVAASISRSMTGTQLQFRALSRHRARDPGSGRRPDRHDDRPVVELAAAGAAPASIKAYRGDGDEAPAVRAGHSDRGRSGPAGLLHLDLARRCGCRRARRRR